MGLPQKYMPTKKEFARLKREGICIDCYGKALPFHIRCLGCLEKNRLARKKYYDSNREKCLDYLHTHRQYNKDHNLCLHCSAPIDDDDSNGSIYCLLHRSSKTRNAGNNGKPFDYTQLIGEYKNETTHS